MTTPILNPNLKKAYPNANPTPTQASTRGSVTVRPRELPVLERELFIFASTFNAGPVKSIEDLGVLEAWVPRDYDVYVIVSPWSNPDPESSPSLDKLSMAAPGGGCVTLPHQLQLHLNPSCHDRRDLPPRTVSIHTVSS